MAKRRHTAAIAAPRPRRRNSNRTNTAINTAIAATLGGAVGAVGGGLLVRSGVKPSTAAIAITGAGAVGATMTKGMMRAALGGVAASGAGQLALSWVARQSATGGLIESAAPQHQLHAHSIDQAFRNACADLDRCNAYEDDDVRVVAS